MIIIHIYKGPRQNILNEHLIMTFGFQFKILPLLEPILFTMQYTPIIIVGSVMVIYGLVFGGK